ncbi:hypothetical protein AXG93_4240s1070 [Marchantia polymorpha subsp. ruderalis]|uniref:Uncharacterized protein n=1 Tax=Marchantia polymorpha subsp. ruderalis TaxID=1480154 RepID=A0A176WD97_MARPO|nr:hypothetical protein AXG93_4240s1070 [Marchantia polymorpha subsp. ruderalis]
MTSQGLQPSERKQPSEKEDVPQPKKSEEQAKELTLSEEILQQVEAQIGGTVKESPEISSPHATKEVIRSEAEIKSSEERPRKLVVAFPDFLQDSVVSLLKYLDGKRKKYAISKETRSARGEETPQLKMNEYLEKESTLSEEILEQVVARIGGMVVEAKGITLPTSPVEEVRSEEGKKA